MKVKQVYFVNPVFLGGSMRNSASVEEKGSKIDIDYDAEYGFFKVNINNSPWPGVVPRENISIFTLAEETKPKK